MSEREQGRRRRWLTLVPAFEEPVAPEFYRFSGRVRVFSLLALLVLNWLSVANAEQLGFDRDVYVRFHLFNTIILGACVATGWTLWRRGGSVHAMRRLTQLSIALEASSTIGLLWVGGAAFSHIIVLGMLMVLVYRAYFDFSIGLLAFVLLVGGHWLVIALQASGAIPRAPMVAAGLPPPYDTAEWEVGAMTVTTVMYAVTFVTANMVVARLHHKELAIRLLRENLAAAEPGAIGRHTGRTLCDTYVLGHLVGRGGMGEVYRASHRRTRQPVAVKVLLPHLLDDPWLLRRFRREAEVTASLGSEHIVELIDIDEEDDQPFIVYELLEGESLADRLTRCGHLSADELVPILEGAAAGLDAAHRAGVVHRDLKPANLFLVERDGREVPKVVDFGISKIQSEATALTREVALLGTPDFMSPEQAAGAASEVDTRSDVYSLGALAYNCLTGVRPFSASSVPALLRRICHEEPVALRKRLPDAPAGIEDVIAIAMAKRADQRYASAGELARDFAAAANGQLPVAVRERALALDRGAPATESIDNTVAEIDALAIARGKTITADDR